MEPGQRHQPRAKPPRYAKAGSAKARMTGTDALGEWFQESRPRVMSMPLQSHQGQGNNALHALSACRT
jgi:hypothetical protein